MKVKQLEIETFKPISIVLETREEVDLLKTFLGQLSLQTAEDILGTPDKAGTTHQLTGDIYEALLSILKL